MSARRAGSAPRRGAPPAPGRGRRAGPRLARPEVERHRPPVDSRRAPHGRRPSPPPRRLRRRRRRGGRRGAPRGRRAAPRGPDPAGEQHAYGGGVAELLVTHVALLQDLGIDAAVGGDRGHRRLLPRHEGGAQRPAGDGGRLDAGDGARSTGSACARTPTRSGPPTGTTCSSTIPSPPGSCRSSRSGARAPAAGRGAATSTSRGRTRRVWEFFEPIVNRYDAAVFTMEEFAQPGVDRPAAGVRPALDRSRPRTKNRDAGPTATCEDVLRRYHVDPDRPLAVQVSRFDPWKDPLGVIDAFRLAREEVPGLQLVMAGSMAADDPEGMEYLDADPRARRPRPRHPPAHRGRGRPRAGGERVPAGRRTSSSRSRRGRGSAWSSPRAMWKRRPVIGGNVGRHHACRSRTA